MNKTRLFSYQDVASRLRYDPESGSFFRVKTTRRDRKAGDLVAGHVNNVGYVVINLFQRPMLAHRLAYLLMTGHWPKDQIDHINRDRTDNRWSNLRPATLAQNNANAVKSAIRQLPVGVTRIAGSRRYKAEISVKGRTVYLGSFERPDEASQAYSEAKVKFHGPFGPQ